MGRRKKEAERPPVQIYPFEVWLKKLNKVWFPRGGFIEPLSEEWRDARRGRLTASLRAEIIYKRNPKSWNLLMDKLDRELSPDYQWNDVSYVKALNWGRDHEKEALANVVLDYGDDITDPGLIFHRQHPFIAATPDGISLEKGIKTSIQVKCPHDSKIHLAMFYQKRIVDATYFYQVQWEAWVAKAQRAVFYSYDRRQPFATRLFKLDVPINEKVLDTFHTNALEFATMYCEGRRFNTGKTTAEGVVMPHGGEA